MVYHLYFVNNMKIQIYQNLIDHFGGQKNTAIAIGVEQPTVSGYLNGRWKMPPIVAIRAEKATDGKFKAIELCPSLKEFQTLSA